MNRRGFLKAGIGASLACLAAHPVAGHVDEDRHLNLLIIHTDELDFRTLGCYRNTLPYDQAYLWGPEVEVGTPNIDWLAENGALCTSFYAPTPMCSPSRASFVSGRYPQNTGVTTNNVPLRDGIVTFAELLRRRGYATGYSGKWHLDGPSRPGWAPERRFGFEDNRYMFNRGHWKKLEDTPEGPRVASRKGDRLTYAIDGADEKSYATDFLADRTVEFVRTHRDSRFCYMVSFPDPHEPNSVRSPYDTMYQHLEFEPPRTHDISPEMRPSWGTSEIQKKFLRYRMAEYFGMVKCIDDNVGKIIGALRSEGLLGNTIVVLTSDHGSPSGEHGLYEKSGPYEGSAKIPFVLYCADRVSAETIVDEALTCADFLPTVLSIMKVPTQGTEDGRDCSFLFTGGGPPSGWKDITFMRSWDEDPGHTWLAAVTDRYKLVYSPDERPWLLDLEEDPDELKNFFRDPAYEKVVRELSRELLRYGDTHSDPYLEDPRLRLLVERAANP